MIHRLSWISYAKAGYLLHLVTIIEIFFFLYLYNLPQIGIWLNTRAFEIKISVFIPFSIPVVIAQLDAYSRFQNYKLVKDHLYLHGFQPRLIRPFIKSRCQRDAVMTAAKELGMSDLCKNYFRSNGYLWYDIIPDIIFNNPKQLMGRSFWKSTLFTKIYRPKIDFRQIARVSKCRIKIPPVFCNEIGAGLITLNTLNNK